MRSPCATATRTGVLACRLAVRIPPSSTARSPSTTPGPDLGHVLAVHRHRQHAVEEEEERVAGVALLDEELAFLDGADLGALAARHDRDRELALERGLDRGDERLGVLIAPRRVLAERVAVPLLEVGEADLGRELLLVVVHPVPRELARPEHLEARRAVGADGERERGPHRGRAELHERRVLHPPGRGEAGAPARGLHERDLGVGAGGLGVEVGELDGLERRPQLGQAHGGGAHEPAAGAAGVDDLAVLDLDPRLEPVGEAEPTLGPPLVEVVDDVGRGVVVAGDPGVERALQDGTGHRLRRDPRDAGDRRLDSHVGPPRQAFACESTSRQLHGGEGADRPEGRGSAPPGAGDCHLVGTVVTIWNGGSWGTDRATA